jgi:hypothetical protein
MEYRNILPLLVAFSIHQVLLDCCVVCQIFLAASKIEVVSTIVPLYTSEATPPCAFFSFLSIHSNLAIFLAAHLSSAGDLITSSSER